MSSEDCRRIRRSDVTLVVSATVLIAIAYVLLSLRAISSKPRPPRHRSLIIS
jgi:hypothetical protein